MSQACLKPYDNHIWMREKVCKVVYLLSLLILKMIDLLVFSYSSPLVFAVNISIIGELYNAGKLFFFGETWDWKIEEWYREHAKWYEVCAAKCEWKIDKWYRENAKWSEVCTYGQTIFILTPWISFPYLLLTHKRTIRCRYEIDKVTAGQRLDLNLEKG